MAICPLGAIVISMVLMALHTSDHEFDGAVALLFALDQMTALARLGARLVNPVKLQQLPEVLAHLLLHMAVPPVGCQAVGVVGLFVQGDVIGAFEPDDIIALCAVG